ncbi:ribonuclease H-like domain-containing protein [Rhodocollybia butyracea]|uniref:RNA exonuclease 4 n=1 Tax=Rhodocollybia butyracea TaxID=206335 RepID=A0A9P5Q6C7_9AGAR|nr:ribonuclease H-like domain-containing protein [Rhodocollybia butyracea]
MSKASASSNWLALQKKLPKPNKEKDDRVHKRRKVDHVVEKSPIASSSNSHHLKPKDELKNGESLPSLRSMVLGELDSSLASSEDLKQPGKYIAIDCEMVGIGIDGSESSLARVTLVNYYGAVQLDEFVRQRERVVDYRTQWSGIRESDMVKAKPFGEIQKQVAEMIKDRILVGHAVHNDLKALLLSHPWPLTRDTQYFAGKHKVVRSKYVSLRNLVKQELDITIQGGEHSSLTDARATMAVYRLHRKEWEKGGVSVLTASLLTKTRPKARPQADEDEDADSEDGERHQDAKRKGKRKRPLDDNEDDEDNEHKPPKPTTKIKDAKSAQLFPGGGRKGVSSGLSTIVKKGGKPDSGGRQKTQWWKELGNSGSKSSLRV